MPAAADPETKASAKAEPKSFRAHLDGCPAQADRLESFEVTRPRDRAILTTTRCRDCGGQTNKPTGRFDRPEPKESTSDE